MSAGINYDETVNSPRLTRSVVLMGGSGKEVYPPTIITKQRKIVSGTHKLGVVAVTRIERVTRGL